MTINVSAKSNYDTIAVENNQDALVNTDTKTDLKTGLSGLYNSSENVRKQQYLDLAIKENKPVEVTEERDEYTTVFQNPDGTRTAYIFDSPVRYIDENGEITDIDNEIVAANPEEILKGYQYSNKSSNVDVLLPNSITADIPVSIEYNDYKVDFYPFLNQDLENELYKQQKINPEKSLKEIVAEIFPEYSAKEIKDVINCINRDVDYTDQAKLDEAIANGTATEINCALKYKSGFDNQIDVVYTPTGNGIKEEIVINQYTGINSFQFRMSVQNMTAELINNEIVFKDGETAVGSIPEPFMYDSFEGEISEEDGKHISGKVYYSLTKTAVTDEYILTITADQNFLNDMSTVYPVTIDPSVSMKNTSQVDDSFVTSRYQTTEYGTNTRLKLGWSNDFYTSRGYIKMTSLPSINGGNISSAYYTAYEDYGYTSYHSMDIHRVTTPWTEAAINWSNKAGYEASIVSSNIVNGVGWYTWNITSLMNSWYNGTSPNYGMILKYTNDLSGTTVYRRFVSSDDGGAYAGYFTVNYYDPPQFTASNAYGYGIAAGYVNLSWNAIPNAISYNIYIFNGLAYEKFNVGNTTSWTTQGKGIWPTPAEIASGRYLLHHDSAGTELSNKPSKVYTNSGGSYQTYNNYWFRVTAVCASGESSLLANYAIPTLPADTMPSISTYPVSGNGKSSGTGHINLNWNPIPSADGYKIWIFNGLNYESFDIGNTTSWSTSGKGIWPTVAEIQSGRYLLHHDNLGAELANDPSSVYVNSGGTYGGYHNYWFRISAYNEFGETDYMQNYIMPTLTDTTAPSQPASLTASLTDGSLNSGDSASITLAFNGVVDNPTGMTTLAGVDYYKLEKKENGGSYSFVQNVDHIDTGSYNVVLSNQPDSTSFQFRISAYDNNGNYSGLTESNVVNSLDRTSPEMPFPVTVTPSEWTKSTTAIIGYSHATDTQGNLSGIEYKIEKDGVVILDWPGTTGSNFYACTTASGNFTIDFSSLLQYQDGEYTIKIRSRDSQGNISQENVAENTYKKDTTGVALSLTAPSQNEVIAPLVDIKGMFNDLRLGFWRLEYGLGENPTEFNLIAVGNNNSPSESVLKTWSTASLIEGQTYTLRLHAEDTAGNTSDVTRLITKGSNPAIADSLLQVDSPQLFADTADQLFGYQRINNGGSNLLLGKLYIDGILKGSETVPGEGFTVDMTSYIEGSNHKFFIVSEDENGNKLFSCKTQSIVLFKDLFANGASLETLNNVIVEDGAIKLSSNSGIFAESGYFITESLPTSIETFELKIESAETTPNGTDVAYQYSIDNGLTWLDLPEAGAILNNITTVKIKGILTTSDTLATPVVDSIEVAAKYFIQQNPLVVSLVDNPENLSTLSNVNHTILLRWDPSITPNATYSIYRSIEENGQYTQIATGITTRYWYDYSLNYEQNFYYKITAVASINGSPRESVSSNIQWATVVDSNEIAKTIGKKPNWTFASFETGSGLGEINVASGNLYYQTTDFSHTSIGTSMSMVRNYNSQAEYKTALGYGWDYSFNINLLQEFDANHTEIGMILKMGDGTLYRFTKNADGTYMQPEDAYIDLVKDQITNRFTVMFRGGTKYYFNQFMQLEKLEDRNHNALHMEYDPNRGNLVRVSNDVGDEIFLTYTYVSNASQEADRLDTVSDADVARRVYHYNYDNISHKLIGAYIFLDTENTDKYGEQYIYQPSGEEYLRTVTNPGGYNTDFLYENGKLLKVADAKDQYLELQYNTGETIKTYLNATAKYQYDNFNRLTKLTNSLGQETNYAYDPNSKNNVQSFSYLNKVGTQSNVNVVQSFTYDPLTGDKLTCTTPDGNTIYYTDASHPYTEYGLPTITKTPFKKLADGTVVYSIEYFEYDEHGNMTREAGPIAGNETLYTEHDQFGNIKTVVTKIDGQVFSIVQYNYDSKGRLLSTVYPYNTVVSLDYDSEGNIAWQQDAMGIRTTYTYDIIGRMKTTTRPGLDGILSTADDITDKLDYDKNDNVVTFKEGTTATNPNGSITSATYDSLGRVLTLTDSTNKTQSSSYSAFDGDGNTIVTNKEGEKQSLQNTYDRAGRISKTLFGGITTINNEYDSIGRVLSSTNSAGCTTITECDIMGRVVRTIEDPVSAQNPDGLNIITTVEYDLAGNIIKATDGKGISSFTEYDLAGRPILESKTDNTVTPAKTISIAYDYDNVDIATGTVKTIITTTPSANETRINEVYYDQKGNLAKEVNKGNPNDNLETSILYEYDKNNNNTKKTVSKSNDPTLYITDFAYDKLDRLETTTFAADYYIEYQYDSSDNMRFMTQTKGSEVTINEWIYDSAGRMMESKLNNQSVVKYQYTSEGYLEYMIYPQPGGGERKIKYVYDDKLRLTQIADATSAETAKIREYFYEESTGLLEKLNDYRKFSLSTPDYTEYTEQSFGYDSLGRMRGVCYKDFVAGTGTVKEQYIVQYDNNDNIYMETVDTYYGEHKQTYNAYAYDGFNRLKTEETLTFLDGQNGLQITDTKSASYEYDDLCNRTKMTDETGVYDYVYNQFNQMEEIKLNNVTDTSFTYDSRGNQTTRTKGNTITKYNFDIADRMTDTKQTVGLTETTLAEYKYDGSGQRTMQIVGGNTTRYYYAGTDLLYTDNGTTQRLEENIMELDGSIFATKRFTGASYAGNHYFYRQDIRGSVTNIVGSDAAVVKSYDYDAYGNTTSTGDPNFTNIIAYTGAVMDAATGLYYLNARYYDSATGRFVSADSYRGEPSNPWTWSSYGYCDGNPVNQSDKSGHFFNLVAGLIGAAIGAAVGAAATFVGDIADGKIDTPASEYLGAAATGAVGGLAAGVTCGASLLVTAAVTGASAVVGNVVGQGISKGFDKINYGEALLDGAIAVASFGTAKLLGPVVKKFATKAVSKLTGTFSDLTSQAKNTFSKVTDKVKSAFTKGTKSGYIDAQDIRFTQSSIKSSFKNGDSVYDTINGLKSGKIKPGDIPEIRIFKKDRQLYSLDNRRLFAAQEAGVNVKYRMATAKEIAKESWKFTTKNNGTSIKVR